MADKPQPQVFDPNKAYVWDLQLNIGITGAEFDIVLKALNANLQGNQFQAHILQYEALKAMQGVLKKYVEIGLIKEDPRLQQSESVPVDSE